MTETKIKMKTKTFIVMCVVAGVAVAQGHDWRMSSFTDERDGQTYRTVLMPDGKTWMAQNLNFETDSGSWCYDNDVANCEIYGRLYDWNTAMRVCPAGWRLPSNEEWIALVNAVGRNPGAGTKLKSRSGWKSHSNVPVGTDEFGFSALPGGCRWNSNFYAIGLNGFWWADAGFGATLEPPHWAISYRHEMLVSPRSDMRNGQYSVRCIRAD